MESNRVAWVLDSLVWIWKVRLDFTLTARQSVHEKNCIFISVLTLWDLRVFSDISFYKAKKVVKVWMFSLNKQSQFHLLFIVPVYIPVVISTVVTNQIWQMTFYSEHFLTPYTVCSQLFNIVFESGVVLQVWFSSHGNIFHSNRSHWLARFLPVDHFWAMTNVTVLKMTTFIFNRAWQEKWK